MPGAPSRTRHLREPFSLIQATINAAYTDSRGRTPIASPLWSILFDKSDPCPCPKPNVDRTNSRCLKCPNTSRRRFSHKKMGCAKFCTHFISPLQLYTVLASALILKSRCSSAPMSHLNHAILTADLRSVASRGLCRHCHHAMPVQVSMMADRLLVNFLDVKGTRRYAAYAQQPVP